LSIYQKLVNWDKLEIPGDPILVNCLTPLEHESTTWIRDFGLVCRILEPLKEGVLCPNDGFVTSKVLEWMREQKVDQHINP
jgi:hypothetical protein